MSYLSALTMVACLALGASCGILEPRTDPTRLFVLATLEELDSTRSPAPRGERSLGVGPLSFPDYLRSEIVSRQGVTGIASSRYERWADRLDEGVQRVLSSNLAFLTGAHLVKYPWFTTKAPNSSVRIAFERFELEERARAVLVATWSLNDASGSVVSEHRSRIVRPLPDRDGATAARELSRALVDLCEEIANAWNTTAEAGMQRSSPGRPGE